MLDSITARASDSEMDHIFLMNSGVVPTVLLASKAEISDWKSCSSSSNVVVNNVSVDLSLI